jgi:BMFP domain-containing protein YqiC
MSEDLTKKLPANDSEKLTLILLTMQTLAARVENLEHRFDDLDHKVDERLYDTRPIWQKVATDIAHLQEGQDALRADMGEMKKSMRDVYYRFDVLNNTMLAIRADQRDIYERVRALENHSNPPNSQT